MIERKHWHPVLTDEKIVDAVMRQMNDLDDPGFCIMCGHEQDNCEPDARRYQCEDCGAKQVYGAQELMLHIDVTEMIAERHSRIALWPAGRGDGD